MSSQYDLKGRVAWVTGGSRGLGESMCYALAEAGADIALTYRSRRNDADRVIKAIVEKGQRAIAYCMDVRERASVRDVVGSIKRDFGRLDVLVNNAGINKPTDFDQISDDDWDNVLAVNLRGPFVCAQESLALLRVRGGSIINISSVSGQYGGPRTAHYAASKAGLISLGQVIARFAAKDNVRCNTIAAGIIGSEMAQHAMQSPSVARAAENILLGRLGSREEIARVVVFLASDASSYMTAQTLGVNGGLYF